METLSSPVSSKGQVVIPVKIRQQLQVNTGDRIEFIVQNENVIIQKGQDCKCPVCKGTGFIKHLDCFVCDASGMLNTNTTLYREFERLIRFSITLHLISDPEEDVAEVLTTFPSVKIHSNRYPIEAIEWYQDYLQAKAIEDYFSRGDVDNKNIDLEAIANSFKTIRIRNSVLQLPSVKKLSEHILTLGKQSITY